MDGLKQRVVGALVIVSLAVIFLPMIFDEPHQPSKTQLIPIPVQSELPVITLNSPQKPKFKIIESSDGGSKAAAEELVDGSSKSIVGIVQSDDSEVAEPSMVSEDMVQQNSPSEQIVEEREVVSVDANEKSSPSMFKEKELSNVWMVQLGTFGNHKNAYNLRDSLRESGFDGHTTKIDKDGKQLVRVFSGPYADKAYADSVKKKLDKKFKLKTLVVHFK